MRLLTGNEMEAVERRAVEATGVTLAELMERAGAAVARTAARMAGPGPVVIVSGKGNNGGDGIVAARLLAESGLRVRLFLTVPTNTLTPEARAAMHRLEQSDKAPTPETLASSEDLAVLRKALSDAILAVDCLFGFNLRGAVRGFAADVIRVLNDADMPVLAVDVPSGVEADTGRIEGEAMRAAVTVTFTAPKIGLAVPPGAGQVGELEIADIGIPPEFLGAVGSAELVDAARVAAMLPGRRYDAHKKSVGRVLIVAGSVGMTGAACLAAEATLRTGAGIVTLAVPRSLNDIFEVKLTEAMTVPMPETTSRSLDVAASRIVLEMCDSFDALVIGPGMSLENSTKELVRALVAEVELPVVLDADGLNALTGGAEVLRQRKGPTVITPHTGELSRLLGTEATTIEADRLAYTKRAAAEWGVVALLKGPGTVVSDGESVSVNSTGNAGLATAGTGDVLAGMIGSLIAQGATASEAAVAGSYIHGLAADLAAREVTERCLIAQDVISFLPRAFARVAETAT